MFFFLTPLQDFTVGSCIRALNAGVKMNDEFTYIHTYISENEQAYTAVRIQAHFYVHILICTVQVALSSASFHPDGLILGTGTETGNMQVS